MKCAEYEITKHIGRVVGFLLVPVVWIAMIWVALLGLGFVLVTLWTPGALNIRNAFDAAIYFTAGAACIGFVFQYCSVRDAWEEGAPTG